MAKDKRTFINVCTPKGTLVFPALNTPDSFKGSSKYKGNIACDPNDPQVKAFMDFVTPHAQKKFDECVAEADRVGNPKAPSSALKLHVPWGPHVTKNEDGTFTDTGMILIKTACNETHPPALFDSAKNPISVDIWGGSVAQVAGTLVAFGPVADRCGVSIRMSAVMVHELRTKGQGGASADVYGFDTSSEGGFVAEPQAAVFAETASVGEEGGTGDF